MSRGKITEDEIIRDWTLGPEDRMVVAKLNKAYRLWFSVQLCSLKLFGQFFNHPNDLDTSILGYLCRQLKLPIVSTVKSPHRDATRTEYKKQIFEYLQFSNFEDAIGIFKTWLRSRIDYGLILIEQILPEAEKFLISNKIMVPTAHRLQREINSICHQAQEALFSKVYKKLPAYVIKAIDEMLEVLEGKTASWFQQFKEYPGSATIRLLQDYLIRYNKISEIDLSKVDLSGITPQFSKYLHKMARYYDVWFIKRFRPAKRYTMMLAFLSEAKRVLIDYIIQMHDQYISSICRECKHLHEEEMRQYKTRNEKAIDHLEKVTDYLLGQEESGKVDLKILYEQTIPKEDLRTARDDMRKYKIISRYGYAQLLQNRYNSMRKYFAEFIKLPIQSEKGSHELLRAIELIRKLDNGKLKKLPDDAPTNCIDYNIMPALRNQDGTIKRNLWEIGIAIAIKEGFRSGNLYIPDSNKYVSFWDLIYKEKEWENQRTDAYVQLGLEQDSQKAIVKLVERFHQTAKEASRKLGKDGFAEIKGGKLKLKKKDAIETPADVERLQALIASYLPKIKIEQLLIEVDQMTGFTRHFTPIHGQKSQPEKFYKTLIATILSQATNIGITTMQDCITDVTIDMMRLVANTYIREETIKAANAELVNRHNMLKLSQVHGNGKLSSSDSQRFGIVASSLLASYYPRYFGYYEQAIGIYTHISNQSSVYNTNAISCSVRESLYVIDGFLNNNTILSIKEHTTDTGGYTEHIFALCFLLGIDFMPRIKDLKSQQLYRIDKNMIYGQIDTLLKKNIDMDLISEQWDQMVKVAASLRNKLSSATEVIRRLSKGSPSDKLFKAFTHLGRLIKTEYILRYLTDSALRDKVQRQLNKGEHRHALSRWIFFANNGKFQVGEYEEIMNKASCLSLVSNAVLYWNTVKMSDAVSQLKDNGESISDKSLSHISLLPRSHVIPMGTYFVDGDIENIAFKFNEAIQS